MLREGNTDARRRFADKSRLLANLRALHLVGVRVVGEEDGDTVRAQAGKSPLTKRCDGGKPRARRAAARASAHESWRAHGLSWLERIRDASRGLEAKDECDQVLVKGRG